MTTANLILARELANAPSTVILDCRFSLADPEAGRRQYLAGHIPGAHYLDLNADLSGPVGAHGGRHPLPEASMFLRTLASCGIGPETHVVAYDDSRLAFAARLWWMMRSIGFRPPRLLDGGFAAWVEQGLAVEQGESERQACEVARDHAFSGVCDILELREAQERGALLVDSREPRRYQGLEEPVDPVAGHIPGAVNCPWQDVTLETGRVGSEASQRQHLAQALDAGELVVYCGSGVTACVNLFALAMLGREDATLYGGSWSDWCSYLEED